MKQKDIFIIGENYSQFKLLDNSFNIINLSDNDLIIDSTIDDNRIYIKATNDSAMRVDAKSNVIDFSREHDLTIMNNIKKSGINVPDFIFGNITDMVKTMSYKDTYILKSLYGARSIGQMFVTVDTMIDIIEYLRNDYVDFNDFNNKFKVDLSTCNNDNEKAYLFNSIKSNNCFLSKKVDFEYEYRVLYIGDKFFIEERNGYQIHSNEKRSHKMIYVHNTCCVQLFKRILVELESFIKNHKSPCLSFDVYINGEDWGLFEYSNQFGIVYPEYYIELQTLFSNVIRDEIDKLEDKNGK